jgi:NAD(P)-dependent dehydrogenase (short-subunit alcohol dehydrogenase family)
MTAFEQYNGTPSVTDLQKTLWTPPLEDANSALGLNTMSTVYTAVAFLHLLDAGNTHPDSVGSKGYVKSQIVTTSSIAGLNRRVMLGYPYGASKAALVHVTKMLSTQFAPYGIRANTIAPGLFPSEATEVRSFFLLRA